jgi:predicted phosphodiesterase
MKIGILSDIHSNLEALTAGLEWLDGQGVDRVVCLGDVVGYGPNPNECCELVRKTAGVTLLGNHDAAVIGAMSTDYYRDAARVAIQWTRRQLTSENLQWLYQLPYTYRMEPQKVSFFHSAPICPSGYFYVVFKDDALAHLRMFERLTTISLLGHSHLIRAFRLSADKAKEVAADKVRVEDGTKYIISVGSIGQPRDRDPRGAVSSIDTESGELTIYRFDYDRKKTAAKIKEAGLEPQFGERLFTGS